MNITTQLKRIASFVSRSGIFASQVFHMIYSRLVNKKELERLLKWVPVGQNKNKKCVKLEPPKNVDVRLFSWQLSYFSGKIRAYLTYKSYTAGLKFEDINATPEIIQDILYPTTKTHVVPQLQLPDGSFINDTSEIIDKIEELFPIGSVIPGKNNTCQRLVVYIIELLADEWMLVPGYHWRWRYNWPDSNKLHHLNYNQQQWGMFFNMEGTGKERARSGNFLINFIKKTGPPMGLIDLGCPEGKMAEVWEQSMHGILKVLEEHLNMHDYILGGSPSLADFALMGPLYAHMYRDPVSGLMIKTTYPLVCEWIERTVGIEGPNRSYKGKTYTFENGKLVGKAMLSDGGAWLPNDKIPDTLFPLLRIFFEEMWPVLESSMKILTTYLHEVHAGSNHELPSTSFGPSHIDQFPGGVLTHEFELKGSKCRRMVVPYQIWMLQRLEKNCLRMVSNKTLKELLTSVHKNGKDIFELKNKLQGCQIVKKGGILYPITKDIPSKL